MKRVSIIILFGLLMAVLTFLGVMAYYDRLAELNTDYAEGFSEQKFQSVEVGDRLVDVYKKCGHPLFVWVCRHNVVKEFSFQDFRPEPDDRWTTLRYTWPMKGDNYVLRDVHLEGTHVKYVHSGIHND